MRADECLSGNAVFSFLVALGETYLDAWESPRKDLCITQGPLWRAVQMTVVNRPYRGASVPPRTMQQVSCGFQIPYPINVPNDLPDYLLPFSSVVPNNILGVGSIMAVYSKDCTLDNDLL